MSRTRTIRLFPAGLVLLALAVSACGAQSSDGASPVTAPSPTPVEVDLASVACPASVDALKNLVVTADLPFVTTRAGAQTQLVPAAVVNGYVTCEGGGEGFETVQRVDRLASDPESQPWVEAMAQGLPVRPPSATAIPPGAHAGNSSILRLEPEALYQLTVVDYATGPDLAFVSRPTDGSVTRAVTGTDRTQTNGRTTCALTNRTSSTSASRSCTPL